MGRIADQNPLVMRGLPFPYACYESVKLKLTTARHNLVESVIATLLVPSAHARSFCCRIRTLVVFVFHLFCFP